MSESTGKEIPSAGAVPKDTQNKKKRSSKNKNKYRKTETGTGEIVQAGSESFAEDQSIGGPFPTEEIRRKKRNKSVSFALEDEGTSKKFKDDPAAKNRESRVFRNSRMKKPKKNGDQIDDEIEASSSTNIPVSKKHKLRALAKAKYEKMDTVDVKDESDNPPKKRKKPKRSKTASTELTIKRKESNSEDEMTSELENLQISPKQNNLTSLLDDMVPTSQKLNKKNLGHKLPEPVQTDINSNVSDDFDLKKVVKWTKKRWNKDKKGASVLTNHRTSVIVQGLPKTPTSSVYQKQLADVFEKCGRIKRMGPAGTQPEKDGEAAAVFSTTIYFETEEAANKALDIVSFEGSAIRVSRPLPPSETTVVARCFSQLTIEELRGIFGGAGALLNVRAEQRRGGRMAVAFLEFDGPEAVQRALALSGTTKINGKPVYVNKFEVRD